MLPEWLSRSMIDPVERKHNLNNLRYVSERISELEHFIFFGTLLGYQREDNVIEGDDDIDIYVDAIHRDEIEKIFENSELVIDSNIRRNKSRHFLQGHRIIDEVSTYVDFYFYDGVSQADYVIEKWNFLGRVNQSKNAIHVPKDILFPITKSDMQGISINIPQNPEACCAFLYGESWRTPMRKRAQYGMQIIEHKPVLVVKTPTTLNFNPDEPLAGKIEVLENVVINPYTGEGGLMEYRKAGVFDEDGHLCVSTTPWRHGSKPLLSKPDFPAEEEIETLKGTYIYGGLLYVHFGHFLCESTSRLWAFDHVDQHVDGIFYIPRKVMGWPQKAIRPSKPFFAAMGLGDKSIHAPVKPVRVERLIVAPQGFGTGDMITGAPEFRKYMMQTLGKDIPAKGPKKLYISRTRLFSRRGSILGEDHFEAFLEAESYGVFHPQNHSIEEQIAHYKAADKIISLDASALHLAAFFARPDQDIAILNRRPGSTIETFVAQYDKFAGVVPTTVDAVSRFWHAEGQKPRPNELYSLMDFSETQKSLTKAGFVSGNTPWPALSGQTLDDAIAQVEERMDAKLVEVTV